LTVYSVPSSGTSFPKIRNFHVPDGRGSDPFGAREIFLSILPPSPDVHPHEPRIRDGEEDDWTDGQRRNIRPIWPHLEQTRMAESAVNLFSPQMAIKRP